MGREGEIEIEIEIYIEIVERERGYYHPLILVGMISSSPQGATSDNTV